MFIEARNSLDGVSSEEAKYLNRFAYISNVGASTRIENAVLTDNEIEWVDTALTRDSRTTAFEEKKNTSWISFPGTRNGALKRLPDAEKS